MPVVNQAMVASAGVFAISVAVTAAIVAYESPELRRMADDVRRRIALVLQSIGEGIDPSPHHPRFNRPEDAHGFLRSRGHLGNDSPIDADEETRRIQREELIHWNAVRLQNLSRQRENGDEKTPWEATKASPPRASRTRSTTPGPTFDDLLQHDESGEPGACTFKTGSQMVTVADSARGVAHRRPQRLAVYTNPFTDEYCLDVTEPEQSSTTVATAPDVAAFNNDIKAEKTMPDEAITEFELPGETECPLIIPSADSQQQLPSSLSSVVLFDAANESQPATSPATLSAGSELATDEFMTAGQEDRCEAYEAIQAWAQDANDSFYTSFSMSLPSESASSCDGALTPADSASVAGSAAVDIGRDAAESVAPDDGRSQYDMMSEDGDGNPTPVSWTEIGSVVSESDANVRP